MRRRAVRAACAALLMWLLSPPPAAAAGCAPFDEIELRSQLLDLRSALELDQQATHDALVTRIVGRVPCLTFAPPSKLWAAFLVHVALRAFAADGDWEAPLDTALAIHPLVDRGVGPGHPMFARSHDVPADPPSSRGRPPPAGYLLFVDGDSAVAFPADGGVHLVQLFDGRFWASALLQGEGIPPGWAEGAIDPPPHVAVWVTLAGGAVGARSVQRAIPAAADWFSARPRLSPGFRLAADARTALRSPLGLGVAGDVHLTPDPRTTSAQARVSGTVSGRWGFAGAGAGVVLGVVVAGGGSEVQRLWLAFPCATVGVRSPSWEARAGLGVAPAVQLGEVEVALLRSGERWRLRLGGYASYRAARFEQVPATGIGVASSAWVVGATLGAAWSTET
jgi:hypothetical protein